MYRTSSFGGIIQPAKKKKAWQYEMFFTVPVRGSIVWFVPEGRGSTAVFFRNALAP